MSKGSQRRREDIGKIWDNWDAIFKKDQPQEEPVESKDDDSRDEPSKENAK
jgi:hypothetical protein